MREALYNAGNIAALIVAIGLVGVWITYGLLFRWSRRKAGKAFYLFLSSLTALIVLNTVTLWAGKIWLPQLFGDETVLREITRLGVYLFAGYALAWIVYAMMYNWRRAGAVLDLEERAAKARAALDGVAAPHTEEIETP